jgi:glycogen operon protein
VLAAESVRARCLVVGEDLGTVQEGLRERLAAADVLSYRVLWFEREGPRFVAPGAYPALAAATVSTHDLPTIAGWWGGVDIAEKATLGLLDAGGRRGRESRARRGEAGALERDCRSRERRRRAPSPDAPHDASTTAAIHRYAGATASALVLVQADDLAGETTALNLPAPTANAQLAPEGARRASKPVADAVRPPHDFRVQRS